MLSYKLIKIYDDEDQNKIQEKLKVSPIKITQNIVAVRYGTPNLPYFVINSFILRENMDHVILYSNIFLKLLNIMTEYKYTILKIKLLDIQEQIEGLIDDLLKYDNLKELNNLLEKYIPQRNIDIQFIQIRDTSGQETLLYNNGVISTEINDDKLGELKEILCSGL